MITVFAKWEWNKNIHEKKYNRGEEEFVIIKNHHEPIISRELFEKAEKIFEEKQKKK